MILKHLLERTARDNLHTLEAWLRRALERSDSTAIPKLLLLMGRWRGRLGMEVR